MEETRLLFKIDWFILSYCCLMVRTRASRIVTCYNVCDIHERQVFHKLSIHVTFSCLQSLIDIKQIWTDQTSLMHMCPA